MDSHVGGHVWTGGIWRETDLSFYRNGTLLQGEKYTEVRIDAPLEAGIFEPGRKPSWIP